MGFGQLYYTSCRTGLSGYPGYQFNAATPGIGPEVMRDVEALTACEPPRSFASAATAEEIAGFPVNLCYLPGPATVLANVVFLGEDYSRRYGNYFAHALVTAAPERTSPAACRSARPTGWRGLPPAPRQRWWISR